MPVFVIQVSALAFEFKSSLGALSFVGLLLVAIVPLGSDSFYFYGVLIRETSVYSNYAWF